MKWLTDFAGGINVFDMEDAAEAIEKHFGQCWDQLSRCDEYVNVVRPLCNDIERFQCQGKPIIGETFDFLAYLHPMISALCSKQTWMKRRHISIKNGLQIRRT